MLAQDYFTLKLVRLTTADEWSSKQDGLWVLLIKGGAGKLTSGAAVLRLAPGEVLMINGAAGGRLSPADRQEIVFWSFFLRLDQLYPLFAGSEISLLEGMVNSLGQPRHFPAALPLAKQCHRLAEEIPPQFNLDHRSQLLRVAALILTEEFKTIRAQRVGWVGIEEHLLKVFEQLSAEELLAVSVGELAAKFSCSRRHLNRLFHQYFGISVAALRMELRLLKAVSLLRDVNAKVINVAEQCGFNHLGLFNTCFKRRFGVSPGQWRKHAAQGESAHPAVRPDSPACPLHSKGLCPLNGATAGAPNPTSAGSALRPAHLNILPANFSNSNSPGLAVSAPPAHGNGTNLSL